MKQATEEKLRKALTHLLDTERAYERARVARDEAAKSCWRAQSERVDAEEQVAKLLEAEEGAVTHDGHSFMREGQRKVRVVRVARELHVEQKSLLEGSENA